MLLHSCSAASPHNRNSLPLLLPSRNKLELGLLPHQGGTQRPQPAPSHQDAHNKLFFQAVATCKAFPQAEHMGPINRRPLTTLSCSNSLSLPRLHPPAAPSLAPTSDALTSDRSGTDSAGGMFPIRLATQRRDRREREGFSSSLSTFSRRKSGWRPLRQAVRRGPRGDWVATTMFSKAEYVNTARRLN